MGMSAVKQKRKRLVSRDTEQWLAFRIGVPLAYYVIKAIKYTWRIERVGGERAQLKPCIFAIYHGDLLVAAYELPRLMPNVDVLTSRSRDGSLVARFVHMFRGARTIRGGSSQGGTGALLQMRRCALKGHSVVIPIDGPRGPEGKVKPGIIAVASQSGVPIVPGAVQCNSAWRFRSWDRMILCKPFARVRLVYGQPFLVPRDLDRTQLEAKRAELETIMSDMHKETAGGA